MPPTMQELVDSWDQSRALRVFLCHSANDKPTVRALYQKLRAEEGIDPWLDEEDILAGQDWSEEIQKAIGQTDIVIVCLSSGSINKVGYIQKEIKYALDIADRQPEGAIFLIPLRLEICKLPNRLSHLHRVDLFEERGYERLMKALRVQATAMGLSTTQSSRTSFIKEIVPSEYGIQKSDTVPLQAFVIYAHQDKRLRGQLAKHMAVLNRQDVISVWYDGDIAPGQAWDNVIAENLRASRVFLLLVSPDLLASDYIHNTEMDYALKMHDEHQAVVIPIIIRPCEWKETRLKDLQALPRDGKPITLWPNRDKAWTDVVQGIRRAIDDLNTRSRAVTYPSQATERDSDIRISQTGTTFVGTGSIPPHIGSEPVRNIAVPGFLDVPPNKDYYNAILYLQDQGLLLGYDDGTFRPNSSMTRGQFAKLLSNATKLGGTPIGLFYMDVPENNTFYVWIMRLTNQGGMSGYSCGGEREPCDDANRPYFRPFAEVTREMLAEYVSKSAGFADSPTGQTFEDVPPNHPSYAWIERLATRNILSGYACGTIQEEPCKSPGNRPYFRPVQKALSGEIALVVARAFFPEHYQYIRRDKVE
jgi:hypothetical protein